MSDNHENPIDVSDVSDSDRADMLREYLELFADEFGEPPRLMPLDSEGKGPIITGRCKLNSEEAASLVVDAAEAVRRIEEEGARGFAIYAGKSEHNTESAVFVDHDHEEFPTPTAEPTLEVLSGSGRGHHETYRNAGDVANARVGENYGEIRAENWYVVAPGSVHPTGGVYHITERREINTLSDADLDDSMRPASKTRTGETVQLGDEPGEGDRPSDEEIQRRLEKAFKNSSDGERIEDVYNGKYKKAGFDDRSGAEYWLACRLDSWVARKDRQLVAELMDKANLQKWPNRTDAGYRDSVLSGVGHQDWYYDPDGRDAPGKAPEYENLDEDEVERGENLLSAECSPTDPAGELEHRNGHYGYWNVRRDDTGEIVEREFDAVTNFTLETLEHLETDEGDLLKLRVHPAHPMEDEYDVDVHPTVFNETRSFKEEIVRGKTTRYEPGKRSQTALNDLRETVGSQVVPQRTGVEHIGLHGDEFDEWVTPLGTLTADGAADDPEHKYFAKGGSSDSDGGALARKWKLDPEEAGDYDRETVARIAELLPETRRHDRGLPILGWFYSAPLRPLIHEWEGEFNLLQVVGSTGTGKTSTLNTYWEAFGMDPDPFSASDTVFTLTKHMSSSCGVPVWIDEYKPADIANHALDKLHRRLREVTKGGSVSKGKPDLGEVLFSLQSPVVISGEQKFSQNAPAVRRRAVMTTLSEAATREGTEYTRAFSELTGTPYDDEDGVPQYPEGYDLSQHARAYYRFILKQSPNELRELWNQTRRETADMLTARELSFQNTEFQGAQTVLFGVRLFERFAESVGASADAIPTDDEIADAFDHYGSNIGKDGKRLGYDDAFLELFAQAATAGYIERDKAFRFIDSQKFGCEVLAFHMPTVDAAVRRYVRDYNLEDEYTLVGKTDVLAALKDKSERADSHVKAVNMRQRLEGGGTKCVVIDPHSAKEVLGSGFDLRAFDRGGEAEDGGSVSDDGDGDSGGEGPQAADNADATQQTATADGGTETATADGSDDEMDETPDGSGGPAELVSVAVKAVEACVERGAGDDPAAHGEAVSWITEHTDLSLHRADDALDEAKTRGAIHTVAEGKYRPT